MARCRPCRVCRKWFLPHLRAGDRQHVCSQPACQKEWHRRNCANFHKKCPDYDRETHLERRIEKEEGGTARCQVDPLEVFDWAFIRKAVGLETAVLVRGVGQVILRQARDPVPVQRAENKGVVGKVIPSTPRDPVRP